MTTLHKLVLYVLFAILFAAVNFNNLVRNAEVSHIQIFSGSNIFELTLSFIATIMVVYLIEKRKKSKDK